MTDRLTRGELARPTVRIQSRRQLVHFVGVPHRTVLLTRMALLAWWVAYLYQSSAFAFGAGEVGATTAARARAVTTTGTVARQLSVVILVAIALPHLRRGLALMKSGQVRRRLAYIMIPLGAYCTWALATLAWTQSAPLTQRRLVALILIVAAVGMLGTGFYGAIPNGMEVLARDIVVAGGISMAVLWVPRLLLGDIALLDPSWSLQQISVGNEAAGPIAFLAVGTVFVTYTRRGRLTRAHVVGSAVLLLLSIVTLFALRKRMVLAIGVVVVLAYVFAALRHDRRRRNQLALALGVALAALAMLDALVPAPILESALPLVSRGQSTEEVASLSGRTALWTVLIEEAERRPLQGYGFGAFWHPGAFEPIQRRVGWPAVSAHNGYLDELLGTGVTGLALSVTVWMGLLLVGLKAARRSPGHPGHLLAGWVAIFLLLNLTSAVMHNPLTFLYYAPLLAGFTFLASSDTSSGQRILESGV